MTGIPDASGLMFGLLILAAAMVAGCEEIVYGVQDNPEVVRMLGQREVTIMEQKF
ncbi:hypothetical protein [Defluviimonas sp. SAOS-178_SWC]|uniref:hypothetical protein n=1 Tax=Defluviimonas sp. SAOS-178_SWC TaxID=3121287 RepID=UPI0032219A30